MRLAKNNWPAYECPYAAARKSAGHGRSLLTFDTAQVRRLLAEIGAGGRLMALEGIGPLPPRHWLPAWEMLGHSRAGVSSPPGWA
jgi:hypothetical protein